MKIVCVCGMGLGSSVIAKMTIESVARDLDLDALVETCDVGSVRSVPADVYVTTRELAPNIPSELQDRTIVLTNFIAKPAIAEALEAWVRSAGDPGRG